MKLLKNIKNFLYKADFFYTTELLRYKDEPEFRTIFGGVLSLIIIITLISTFYNKFVDTLNKVIITSVSNNMNAADPTPYTISTFSHEQFMLGVEIWHHDLNTGNRYFDVVLTSAEFQTGERKKSSVEYDLEPCQLSHWEGFPEVQAQFTRLKMNQWLCLPKNKTYNIQGKYASQFSQTLQVAVKKCTNSSKYNRPCASQAEIDRYFDEQGPLYFTIYFINPLINPSSQQYLTYYLQDNNYIIFTNQFGSEGILFMEEYEIATDESILPYSQLRVDQGGIVNELALKNPYQIIRNQDVYCSFSFFKSGIKRTYERNFQKLDQILSYIGGLFGTIAVSLFIVNAYNSNSFEINLGAYLFHSKNQKEENELKKYNFLSFLTHLVYTVFDLIGCPPKWKTIKKYFDCQEQMKKQLDILYLLERVFFLERTINTLLEEHQVKGLYLHEKLTLQEAKRSRKNFRIKRKVLKLGRYFEQKQLKQRNQRKMTEQTLQIIQPQGFEGQKQQILMDITSSSKESETNEIQRSKKSDVWKRNKIRPLDTETEYISGSSSSSEEDDQVKTTFANDITKLKRQSENGNILSQKIWEKINPSLKQKIRRIQFFEQNPIAFKDEFKQKKEVQTQEKYLDSPDSHKYPANLNSQSQIKLSKSSKMKIKKPKQSLTEQFQFKDKRIHEVYFQQNVLIENQLKNSPNNFS